MSEVTRREAIGSASMIATGLALTGAAGAAAAQESARVPAFAGAHQPKPLRFDPAKLAGLLEPMITSHWENNYHGSVGGAEHVEEELAAAMAHKDFPPLLYGGLKREELHRTGSVILHEYYFDGLGGDGRPASAVAEALAHSHGGVEAWEEEFRRTAMSLAGGSGWTALAFNPLTRTLHNYWAWDHVHGAVTGVPLIALDRYEHSYHMDYGTAAARYVDAFMANLDSEVIDARYQAAA